MAENLHQQQLENNQRGREGRIPINNNNNQNLHYQELGMDSLLRENGK
jgi:hypothetical protein